MKRLLFLFVFVPFISKAQIPDSVLSNIKEYARSTAEGEKDLERSIVVIVSKDYVELDKIASNGKILSEAQAKYPKDYTRQLLYYKENDTSRSWPDRVYVSGNTYLAPKSDRFTKEKTYQSKLITISNNGKTISYYIELHPAKKEMIIIITPKTNGCIDENANVAFLLNGGSVINMSTKNEFNCMDAFALISVNLKGGHFSNKGQFEDIIVNGIDAIKIGLHSSDFEYEFTQDQSFDFQDLINGVFDIIEK